MDDYVESPCIGLCFFDEEVTHCTGCFRTVDELTNWYALSNKEKRAVIEKARERKDGEALSD